MTTISIQDAQAKLAELIHTLPPGAELAITENDEVVATLARAQAAQQWPCKAGSAKGKIWMAPDFDAPLEEFKDYSG